MPREVEREEGEDMKYPTEAQIAAGYIPAKEITKRQYVRACHRSIQDWVETSPKMQKAMEDMLIFGSSTYLITTDDSEASLQTFEKHLPRLP